MKTVWSIYLLLLIYYLLGTAGILFINRSKDPPARRRAWKKHLSYFVVINILFFSIVINPVLFRALTILIIITGFYELFKLFLGSGFSHKRYYRIANFIFLLFSAGFLLFSLKDKGVILLSVFVLSIFDGFSQITGQLFGKTKLFPGISPNKTVEGLIGGTLIAALSVILFKNLIAASALKVMVLAAVVIVFAFIGDAAKSVYKRKYNSKDFSNLIPGHGGFLDRFDSLIAGGAGVVLLSLFIDL